jgi:DNA helicase-2/ATP-dependent DNA helicase PcrA
MHATALDPDQQAAVAHREGPCLVLAGPGSGKTRVIVTRFLRLIDEGVPPGQQLVLTYTVKAAAEMRERAEVEHGPFRGDVPLTNFHSFARRVLREWGWLIDVSPAFHMADAAERWLHMEAVLGDLKPRTLWNPLRPHDLVDALLRLIEAAKQELVTPGEYRAWAEGRLEVETDDTERALLQRHQEAAMVHAALESRYRQHAVLDYDDCILLAERLLRDHAAVREAVSRRIRHVMIDEYQDTNYAQARLVETLVSDHRNLLVVADDDQAIYKFRGASRANLERFDRVYGEHATIVLSANYRSTPAIVRAGAAIIATAPPDSRIDKQLTPFRPEGAAVRVLNAQDERSEMVGNARWCAEQISGGRRSEDIAWLFRTHADMGPAMAALHECGVPYQVHGGRGFFRQPEIKDMLAMLAAIYDPTDSQSLLRCLHLPEWNVSNRGRMALVAACRDLDVPLETLVREHAAGDLDPEDDAAAVRCVEAVTALHASAEREDVRFFAALESSNFLGMLEGHPEPARMQIGANLSKFGDLLETFADWNDDRRVGRALRYLEILRNSSAADEIAAVDSADGGVALLTAHGAKGLEWPVVIISHCTEERWPGRGGFSARLTLPDSLVPETAPPGDSEVDENRRLLYVAATRARDILILSAARRYRRSFKDERPSAFLATLTGRLDNAGVHRGELPAAPPLNPARRRAPSPASRERITAGVSDVIAFKACPRRFQYRRVFHMPVPRSTQRWYGTLVHAVLQTAGMMRLAGQSVSGDEMESLWGRAWDDSRGPKGAHPELRAYGTEQLRRYRDSAAWQEAEIGSVEESFSLPLDHADITGRFDRVDRPGDDIPLVVDYKTGPPKDQDRMQRDLQVRGYAVALSQREHLDDVAVELHYLQTGEVTRVVLGRRELETAYRHISASSAELARAWHDGAFAATPSGYQCGRCEYRTICDEAATPAQG